MIEEIEMNTTKVDSKQDCNYIANEIIFPDANPSSLTYFMERNDKESEMLESSERDGLITNETSYSNSMIHNSASTTLLSFVDDLGKGIEKLLVFTNDYLHDPLESASLSDKVDISEFKRLSPNEREEVLNEVQRISHLNSWDTFGNSPPISPSSLASMNDDKSMEKKIGKRRKVVKFDYPLVSSMKQLPRLSNNEIKELFFTSDEIKQFEKEELEDYEKARCDEIGVEVVMTSATNINSEDDDCCQDLPIPNEPVIVIAHKHENINGGVRDKNILCSDRENVVETGSLDSADDDISCSSCSTSFENESFYQGDREVNLSLQDANSCNCSKSESLISTSTDHSKYHHGVYDDHETEMPPHDQQEFWIPIDQISMMMYDDAS